MGEARVTEIICATDAGREGELIFRLVYRQALCQKPVKRLWISSMEDQAISEGFRKLRPSQEYDPLYQSALCRAQADWLVGINATRLFSVLYRQTLNVGRVMSPTLSMIVDRWSAIQDFRSEPFYTVELKLPGFEASSEKLKIKAEAEKLLAQCQGKSAKVTEVRTQEKTEKPPKLYDLTTLHIVPIQINAILVQLCRSLSGILLNALRSTFALFVTLTSIYNSLSFPTEFAV